MFMGKRKAHKRKLANGKIINVKESKLNSVSTQVDNNKIKKNSFIKPKVVTNEIIETNNIPGTQVIKFDDGSGYISLDVDRSCNLVKYRFKDSETEEEVLVDPGSFDYQGTPISSETGDDLDFVGTHIDKEIQDIITKYDMGDAKGEPVLIYESEKTGEEFFSTGMDVAYDGVPFCFESEEQAMFVGLKINTKRD